MTVFYESTCKLDHINAVPFVKIKKKKKRKKKVTVDLVGYKRPGVPKTAGRKGTVGVCRINEKHEAPVTGSE